MAPMKLDQGKLDQGFVETTKEDGKYPDGLGLYLIVKLDGASKSWLFRYMLNGRAREMGLGATHTYTLAEARARARKCRQQLEDGIDPIEARKQAKKDAELDQSKAVTFRYCAERWMEKEEPTWVASYAATVRRRFEKYIFPKIGDLPIQRFDRRAPTSNAIDLIEDVLIGKPKQYWLTKTKTAEQLQQKIEAVLDWANAKNYIAGDNAASLKGPLGHLLPKVENFYQTTSHTALDYREFGAFMAKLRGYHDRAGLRPGGPQTRTCQICLSPHRDEIDKKRAAGARVEHLQEQFGFDVNRLYRHFRYCKPGETTLREIRPLTAYAVEFLALVATRKSQVREAEWDHIDWEDGLLVCPWRKNGEKGHIIREQGHKTGKKSKEDYVVPLSRQAIAILQTMKERQKARGIQSKYVFASERLGRFAGPIGKSTLNKFMHKSLEYPKLSIHGFRTTFGQWCEENEYPEKDSEMQLGHAIGNKVRRIYKRFAQRIEPRREMMQAWADFCDGTKPVADVVRLSDRRNSKRRKIREAS